MLHLTNTARVIKWKKGSVLQSLTDLFLIDLTQQQKVSRPDSDLKWTPIFEGYVIKCDMCSMILNYMLKICHKLNSQHKGGGGGSGFEFLCLRTTVNESPLSEKKTGKY